MMPENSSTLSKLEWDFLTGVHTREPVAGLTHNFYHYPARFSPLFARNTIKLFTEPGDLVLDPFMGGGTTLVEARYLGRRSFGSDVSSLAALVARVKTTPLSDADVTEIKEWFFRLPDALNLRNPPVRATEWINRGYQRNISGRHTWPIRKSLELALAQISTLTRVRQREFARCVLLKTGQWAIHRRSRIPSAKEFRYQMLEYAREMLERITRFSTRMSEVRPRQETSIPFDSLCLNRSVVGIESEPALVSLTSPKLILTSPPYPGVHVLYHRWQVNGRKETPAPYWIANTLDGAGASFYTFGSRSESGLSKYFSVAKDAFASLAKVADQTTILVQMIGFSDRSWQMPAYLAVLEDAGFTELKFAQFANSPDGRLWRTVPNRKWYTYRPGTAESSEEVVLFHKLAEHSSHRS